MTTVKPLNWVLEDLGLWKAQTNLIACYSVWDCGDHWECSLLDGKFPSAEAAKSAAFADYSARIMSAIEPAGVVKPPSVEGSPLLEWAVDQWKAQVKHRPLRNVHRRSLDDVWRQVIRWAGGDPDQLVGPSHDQLLSEGTA